MLSSILMYYKPEIGMMSDTKRIDLRDGVVMKIFNLIRRSSINPVNVDVGYFWTPRHQ